MWDSVRAVAQAAEEVDIDEFFNYVHKVSKEIEHQNCPPEDYEIAMDILRAYRDKVKWRHINIGH